ncbi:MAG: hypothetical protein LBK58_04295, partial [Prevotellaceae bacterium]|nr:hypothetical protein [Prevotellaceae bacterium]
LGVPLYYAILAISQNPPEDSVFDGTFDYTFDETIPPADILKAAEPVICLKAYLSGIPFLDVVQTPNGFAVVNNTNHAPASKERVERLLEFVKRRLTAALDFLIEFAFSYSIFRGLWKQEEELFNRHTEIVYLTTNELRRYSANQSATCMDLFTIHPVVLSLQSEIAGYFSAAYLDELIEKRRNVKLSVFDSHVFRAIQTIAGLKLQKASFYHLVESEVNYMIGHPDEYPAYMASAEYKLKMSQKYENRQRHATFFFGG